MTAMDAENSIPPPTSDPVPSSMADDFSGHTPGPWDLGSVFRIDVDTSDERDDPERSIVFAGDECQIDINGINAPANARLIAAAPDLLSRAEKDKALIEEMVKGLKENLVVMRQLVGEQRAGLGSCFGETREQVRRAANRTQEALSRAKEAGYAKP